MAVIQIRLRKEKNPNIRVFQLVNLEKTPQKYVAK